MNTEEAGRMLGDLENLLEKQIELARRGDYARLERTARQADAATEKIADAGLLAMPDFEVRRMRLKELYQRLGLLLADKSADVSAVLGNIRKGKKVITAYRSGI